MINFSPDSNWSTAPSYYQQDALWAASAIMAAFPNTPITLTIEIGYTNVGGLTVNPSQSIGAPFSSALTSYGAVKTALTARSGQPADFASVLANLPVGSSFGGTTNFNVNWTVLKAFGMFGLTGGPANARDTSKIDSYVGVGTSWSSTKTKGVFLHEITHGMGRAVSELLALFYRFTASGVRDANGTSTAAYFSVDNGVTNLANFDGTSDFGDFSSSPATIDPSSGFTDCFNLQQSNTPLEQLSPVDIRIMNASGIW